MQVREEFVTRALAGEEDSFSQLCEEYGISRKTGYKWLRRFEEAGVAGLESMSRRPATSPLETTAEMALAVVQLRRARPRWGPKKLRAALLRSHPAGDVPSERTIDRILSRAGEPRASRREKNPYAVRELVKVEVKEPNDLWTVDFKGWWRTQDGTRVNPLTIRDAHSRYVLAVELLEEGSGIAVREVMERLFSAHGRPKAIQCDNGSPFGSTAGRGGLTRLSAWWVSLGIRVVFSRPAHPEDNGAHERMHLDMRIDLEDFAEVDLKRQQDACARWRHDFNKHRPHEALGQQTPADVYRSSPRRHRQELRMYTYAPGWPTRRVSAPGQISWYRCTPHVSSALIGYNVALEPLEDGTHRIWFFDLDLGTIDLSDDTWPRRRGTSSWNRTCDVAPPPGSPEVAYGR